MNKRTLILFAILLMLASLLAGCGTAAVEEPEVAEPAAAEEIADEAALLFSGLVDTETTYAESDLMGMETMDVEDIDKDGETTTRTGVSLNTLLDEVGVSADAVTLVFVADDGYEAEVDLAEARACAECIVAFRSNGGFRMTMPGFPSSAQVKGVVEIRIQ